MECLSQGLIFFVNVFVQIVNENFIFNLPSPKPKVTAPTVRPVAQKIVFVQLIIKKGNKPMSTQNHQLPATTQVQPNQSIQDWLSNLAQSTVINIANQGKLNIDSYKGQKKIAQMLIEVFTQIWHQAKGNGPSSDVENVALASQFPPVTWLPDFTLRFVNDYSLETLHLPDIMAKKELRQRIFNAFTHTHNSGFQTGYEQGYQMLLHHTVNPLAQQELIQLVNRFAEEVGVPSNQCYTSLQKTIFRTYYAGFYAGHSHGLRLNPDLEIEDAQVIAFKVEQYLFDVFKEYYQPISVTVNQ